MAIIVRGDYAMLSRGKHCAKHVPTGAWADRDDNGNLILDQDGKWMLSTNDGFNRKETVYVTVKDGELTAAFGSRSKFSEL
jgi:hypothetical protein